MVHCAATCNALWPVPIDVHSRKAYRFVFMRSLSGCRYATDHRARLPLLQHAPAATEPEPCSTGRHAFRRGQPPQLCSYLDQTVVPILLQGLSALVKERCEPRHCDGHPVCIQ
jgi:hypothetical protein